MMNNEYVLSCSYGKDSLACLGAIEKLGLPLDRIIHAEVWATDEIQADLPPMVEFKAKADEIIFKRYGIKVEHIYAKDKQGNKLTYEKIFYREVKKPRGVSALPPQGGTTVSPRREEHGVCQNSNLLVSSKILGFPIMKGNWCTSTLKQRVFPRARNRRAVKIS